MQCWQELFDNIDYDMDKELSKDVDIDQEISMISISIQGFPKMLMMNWLWACYPGCKIWTFFLLFVRLFWYFSSSDFLVEYWISIKGFLRIEYFNERWFMSWPFLAGQRSLPPLCCRNNYIVMIIPYHTASNVRIMMSVLIR